MPDVSFFLFGARGTGKSTWLRGVLPGAIYLDLLDTSLQLELTAAPHRLEAVIGAPAPGQRVVLDEIQKVPSLLSEVHRLMEDKGWPFALCGSSARKLKRGGADLLAGRAVTITMEPFSSAELGDRFDLARALDWGLLPVVHVKPGLEPDTLSAYVDTYLREEIKEEGAVRNFPPFVRFLGVAGMLNGQPLNAENIARDRPTTLPRRGRSTGPSKPSAGGHAGDAHPTGVPCILSPTIPPCGPIAIGRALSNDFVP